VSQPKPAVQTFDTDWTKIKSWAQTQKIPTVAVNNVYTLDSSRLTSGYYTMSNAERTRAILAAAGMDYNTALPSDNPSAANIIGNTITNAQSIFTGLMPTRLAANIWDTFKDTVDDLEDPARLAGKDPLANALTQTALSWIPGAYDLGTVLKAGNIKAGLEKLAEQPITSLLDVMPGLKYLDAGAGSAIASSAAGEALADRLGVTAKALGNTGSIRIAGKAIGSIKIGTATRALTDIDGKPILDAEGNQIIGTPTLSQRAATRAQNLGVGHILSTGAHTLASLRNKALIEKKELTGNLTKALSQLTRDKIGPDGIEEPGQLTQFTQLMRSGRTTESLINDDSIDVPVREAIKAYQPWEEWHKERMLSSGQIVPLKHPDGTTQFYESTSHLFAQRQAVDQAIEAADKASKVSDDIMAQTQQLEAGFEPHMATIDQIRQSIAGVPAMMQENMPFNYRQAFGALTGKDGILERMEKAATAKDWREFNRLSKEAIRKMNAKAFQKRESGRTATGRLIPAQQGWDSVPMLAKLKSELTIARAYSQARMKLLNDYEKSYEGKYASSYKKSAKYLNEQAEKAVTRFSEEIKAHPPGAAQDVVKTLFINNFLASDASEILADKAAAYLKDKDYAPDIVDRIRKDPTRMWQLITAISDPMFNDPLIPGLDPGDAAAFRQDALNEYDSMRARGFEPSYVPRVSPKDATSSAMSEGVYVNPMKYPTVDAAFKRGMDMSNTMNDVYLGVNKATNDILSRDVTLDFFNEWLKPMLRAGTQFKQAIAKTHLEQIETAEGAAPGGVITSLIHDEYGHSAFDIKAHMGLDPHEFGLDDNETYYIPTALVKQIEFMLGPGQFPLKGLWDKTTGVFKYSLLGLSPRYTMHVAGGGTMLLALRINPGSLKFIGDAYKAVSAYSKGEHQDIIDPEVLQGSAQYGTPSVDQAVHTMGGRTAAKWALQAKLEQWGLNPKVATAVQWASAAADINFRFTNFVSDMQRSIAYLDGVAKAERKGWINDPLTGERVAMTADRAHFLGMQSAERVMGNLQAMTPLEISTARKFFPFYGWTKHVLKYVMTYPVDHPWRTSFLSTLATQNTDNFSSGLDERMQLLLFLGQPDAQGNVSAIDIRELDPFRDVANYATLGGWISALNPIISAPFAAIDPNIIYGSQTLYPNMTYSDVYGSKSAAPSGSPIQALEQEIPEVTVLDDALGLSANARAIRKEGAGEYAKAIFNALNIPFTEVQHLNLQQISAEHEIDRYQQAEADADNAWETGDFSTLLKYPGTVPDPLNSDYNISPQELYAQYQAALKRYPGLPPSETVAPLSSPAV